MRVLAVNAGSSSIKLSVLDEDGGTLASESLPPDAPIEAFVVAAPDFGAVGHRIVHGGHLHRESALLDDTLERDLGKLADLAPLHNRRGLARVEEVSRLLPGTPQVLCFDTAFHASLPDEASTYAVPWEWRERLGVLRYGFHGLSHDWASRRCAELIGRPRAELRIVSCHLGSGASLAAVARGRSVDTTMGMTPNEGLVMATRSGSFGPGAVMWLLRDAGIGTDELEHTLEHESGLRGIAGTGDMRELLARDDGQARLAVAVYLHRLRASIAAMAAAMEGLDALVFTGGVGEHAPVIRAEACAGLGFLGIVLDTAANERANVDALVGERVAVVTAREDLQIAAEVRRVLS
ncbi:MAG TPA: acetate/propionate family kinase [Thermoleophilaceae bacterium]